MFDFDQDAVEKLHLSGKILRETREEIKALIREDMLIIDICEKVETLIKKKGGAVAFPCNVSVNEIAAHYTSPPNDTKKIPKKSIVKIDLGVHIDGYITDTAVTLSFNRNYDHLLETAKLALDAAIENIRPDIRTSKIGKIIESTIFSQCLKPISNLTGHQIGRYNIHAGTSIPNISVFSLSKIKLGGIYAIEPFVTTSDAKGQVKDVDNYTIFRFVKSKPIKNIYAKKLLKFIKKNFRTLPFAERWIKEVLPIEHHYKAFDDLLSCKAISGYPVLVESSRKPVAQAEHTVLVVNDGCVVLT